MEAAACTTPPPHASDLQRVAWPMRITTERMPGGTAFHIFRCGTQFRAEMGKLVPWLMRARRRVLIADASLVPRHVLTIEPLDSMLEAEFIATLGRFLVAA